MEFSHDPSPNTVIGFHAATMDIIAKPERGHVALRQGRRSEIGRIYLITFTTMDRQRVFADWSLATVAIRASRFPQVWRASRPLCWVLMPDHWHGLVELGELDKLSSLVNRLKGNIARAVNARTGNRGPLWSRGFHDHALRADEDLVKAARYIIQNPVRAGMVPRVGMYPFWDATWLK